MAHITYQGIKYPIRELYPPKDDHVYIIASTPLNDVINTNSKNQEALGIDLSIVYYCDEGEMNKTDSDLLQIIFQYYEETHNNL